MSLGRWIIVCAVTGLACSLLADKWWQGVLAAIFIELTYILMIDAYHHKPKNRNNNETNNTNKQL